MSLFFTKCLLYTPASCNAVVKFFTVNPSLLAPSRDAHSLSTECQHHVSPCIASLLFGCSPVAIGLFVVAVIIIAFYAVHRSRLSPHILVKCLERMPSFANSNISSPVAMEGWICRVIASLMDVCPTVVLCCFRQAVRRSVLRVNFFNAAPAAFRVSRAKAGAVQNRPSSALAFAQPCCLSVGSKSSVSQNSPATEVVSPGQVFHAAWNSNRIICSHLNLRNRFDLVRAAQRVVTDELLAFYHTCHVEPSGKWR